MQNNFNQLAITEIAAALQPRGITTPTKIQQQAIPLMISGKDIIARSNTGTGKTLAYLIPIFMKVDASLNAAQAIILTPTRELATQVCDEAKKLSDGLGNGLKAAAVMGGVNIARQIEMLKTKPQIIIGQATRILELIDKKKLSVHNCKTFVLDEADRLLDRNGEADVLALVKKTLKDRQITMFSASLPPHVIALGQTFMKDAVFVNVEEKASIPPNITHKSIFAMQRDKIKILRRVLHQRQDKSLIFVNNPFTIEDVAERLVYHGIKAKALHGSKDGQSRREAIAGFKTGAVRALVASDVAARGLDIENLTLIINLDAPERIIEYQHRAGRAGRAGEESLVITIFTEYERRFLKDYEKAYNIKIEEDGNER